MKQIAPVIFCGCSGTRLWPLRHKRLFQAVCDTGWQVNDLFTLKPPVGSVSRLPLCSYPSRVAALCQQVITA